MAAAVVDSVSMTVEIINNGGSTIVVSANGTPITTEVPSRLFPTTPNCLVGASINRKKRSIAIG